MTAWKLPLIVAALVLPVVVGFAVGGPGLGVAVGSLALVAVIVGAVRARPRGPIGARAEDGRRHVLLVATCPVEEPDAVREIARAAHLEREGDAEEAEVVCLAPARIGFLDRWASDVEGARQAAQTNLVGTVAALAKAGIGAEARVGDEDVVQAVEDQLRSYPATDVVLVGMRGDEGVGEAAAELRERLRARFGLVELGR